MVGQSVTVVGQSLCVVGQCCLAFTSSVRPCGQSVSFVTLHGRAQSVLSVTSQSLFGWLVKSAIL